MKGILGTIFLVLLAAAAYGLWSTGNLLPVLHELAAAFVAFADWIGVFIAGIAG